MRLLEGHHDHVALFVATQIPYCFPEPKELHPFGPCNSIGLLNDEDRLVGGMVFFNYRPRFKQCEIAAACVDPQGLTPRILKELLTFAFVTVGAEKIFSHVLQGNDRSIKNTLAMGFTQEGMLKDYYGTGKNAIVSGMSRADFIAKYGEV